VELAIRRFSLAFAVSAVLHAAAAAALLQRVALGPTPTVEPAAILVDLRWVATGQIETAPQLGPVRVAAAPAAGIQVATAPELLSPRPAPIAARAKVDVKPHTMPRSRPRPAPVAHRSSGPLDSASDSSADSSGDLAADSAAPPASVVASAAAGAPTYASSTSSAGGAGPVGAGSGSTAPTFGSAIRVRYEQQLYVWLARFKQYPMLARSRGIEGTGSVRVRLDRRGRVMARSLEKSTGERLLDEAVVEMTRRADPFPPVPGAYSGDSFEFVAPIEFRLR